MKRFIQGNWKQISERLKAKYYNLSEQDLVYDEGSEEQLFRRLQVKLHMGEGELLSELRQIITQSK